MSEKETINDKIERLKASTEWFYGEDFSLDKAVEKYEESIKLAKDIEKDLNELKNKIEIIGEDFSKS